MDNPIEIQIFIIEDDITFTRILCDILSDIIDHFHSKAIAINYKTYYSSKEATFELGDNPDIVLLDYYIVNDEMEPDTGLQLLKDIRKYSEDIEVIIVSGQQDPAVADMLIRFGAAAYVGKEPEALMKLEPILIKIIERIIKNKRKS